MSKRNKLILLAFVLALLIVGGLTVGIMMAGGEEDRYYSSPIYDETLQLPTLHITSYYDPFTQAREFWHDGMLTLRGAGELEDFTDVAARLRGRGNSTWWDGADKRPLRFRFAEAQSLMGSEYEATDWILIADHFDRTLHRNYAAFYFAEQLGRMSFNPMQHHIHLYVNGEYMGVYLLTDERDVIPGRMELEQSDDPSLSSYFLELDARARHSGTEGEDFLNVHGMIYDLRWPHSRYWTPEHVDYVRDYLESVSKTIRSGDFAGAMELIDLDTFVDFYLVQELFKNPDVHFLSVFMYITGVGEERRLFMGPVWDFDMAAGNKEEQLFGPGPYDPLTEVINYWYRYLMQMPAFRSAVVTRWDEIQDDQIPDMIAHIRDRAEQYQADFERNFERHPILGVCNLDAVPREIVEIETFMGNIEHLLDWFERRAAWLDDYFHGRLGDYDPMWALVEYYRDVRQIRIAKYDEDGTYREARYPIILHYRTMLPLTEIVYLFDLDLDFNEETQTYTLRRDEVEIVHQVGTDFLIVNGEELHFPAPSIFTIRDMIYIPLYRLIELWEYARYWHRPNFFVITHEIQVGEISKIAAGERNKFD